MRAVSANIGLLETMATELVRAESLEGDALHAFLTQVRPDSPSDLALVS